MSHYNNSAVTCGGMGGLQQQLSSPDVPIVFLVAFTV